MLHFEVTHLTKKFSQIFFVDEGENNSPLQCLKWHERRNWKVGKCTDSHNTDLARPGWFPHKRIQILTLLDLLIVWQNPRNFLFLLDRLLLLPLFFPVVALDCRQTIRSWQLLCWLILGLLSRHPLSAKQQRFISHMPTNSGSEKRLHATTKLTKSLQHHFTKRDKYLSHPNIIFTSHKCFQDNLNFSFVLWDRGFGKG